MSFNIISERFCYSLIDIPLLRLNHNILKLSLKIIKKWLFLYLIFSHALIDWVRVLEVIGLRDLVDLSVVGLELLSDVALVVDERLKLVHHLVARIAGALLVIVPLKIP
jgi:hypothetical protein